MSEPRFTDSPDSAFVCAGRGVLHTPNMPTPPLHTDYRRYTFWTYNFWANAIRPYKNFPFTTSNKGEQQ